MNHLTRLVLIVIITLYSSINILMAQNSDDVEKKNKSFSANLVLTHYHRITKNELFFDYTPFNVTPGIELLYNLDLKHNMFISSGLLYQYSDFQSHVETTDRFISGELNIPLILTIGNPSKFSFQVGSYFGKFVHFDWKYSIRDEWLDKDKQSNKYYRKENFYIDTYLSISYNVPKHGFYITPFYKYRIKENWMDHYRSSTILGIKLGTYLN